MLKLIVDGIYFIFAAIRGCVDQLKRASDYGSGATPSIFICQLPNSDESLQHFLHHSFLLSQLGSQCFCQYLLNFMYR